MAGPESGESATLEYTPTWAVAVVCFVLVSVSILIEHGLHLLAQVCLSSLLFFNAIGRLVKLFVVNCCIFIFYFLKICFLQCLQRKRKRSLLHALNKIKSGIIIHRNPSFTLFSITGVPNYFLMPFYQSVAVVTSTVVHLLCFQICCFWDSFLCFWLWVRGRFQKYASRRVLLSPSFPVKAFQPMMVMRKIPNVRNR